MGIVRRQSIKILISLVGGIFLGYFNQLWLFPYCLETEEIGLVRIILSTAALVGIFIPLGAQKVIIRFFPYFKDKGKERTGFLQYLISFPLLGALVVGGLLFLFKEQAVELFQGSSPLFVEYFPFVVLIAILLAYQKVFTAYSRSLLKAVTPNLFQNLFQRALIGATVLLYFFGSIEQSGLVKGLFWSHFAVVIAIALYCYLNDKKGAFGGIGRIPFWQTWEFLTFGAFMMLNTAGSVLLRTIDDILVGAYLGLEETAIYSIAFFIGTLIEVPKRAIGQPTSPLLANARKNDDKEEILKLYQKSSINQLLVGGFIFIAVWLNIDDLFDLIPKGERFEEGKYVVLYIALSKLVLLLGGVVGPLIMTSKWYRFNFYSMLLLIPTTIVLDIVFIPPYGIEGAALATFFATTILAGSRGLWVWSKERMQPFTRETLFAILLFSAVYSIVYFLPMPSNPLFAIVLRSILLLLLTGGGAYLLALSPEGNQLVNKLFRRK